MFDDTNLKVQEYLDLGIELAVAYTPKLLLSLITLFVGLYLIKFASRVLEKAFNHQSLDASLSSFLLSFVKIILKVLLLIIVAGMIGVEMTSIIALVGAAGLAVGLALQGSLANFAGGVLILTFKPFKIGDLIDAQSETGTVTDIQIFYTHIKTLDNHIITIPNGELSNGIVDNLSKKGPVRVDVDGIGIAYGASIDEARQVLLESIKDHKKILKDPAPLVLVDELGGSSVNLKFRFWTKATDSFVIKYDVRELAKKALDEAGISIPFPQRVVKILKEE